MKILISRVAVVCLFILSISCIEEIRETYLQHLSEFDASKEVTSKHAMHLNLENPYKSITSNSRSDNYNKIKWVEALKDGENSPVSL